MDPGSTIIGQLPQCSTIHTCWREVSFFFISSKKGVPGYGVGQTYLYVTEEIIPKYSPDLIVWRLNVNDLWDEKNGLSTC